MEKKTMDTLRTMICGELDDIAKNGILSHETLDILKDLLDSAKNLEKIEKYTREKEKDTMDMGYSQRKYYIDADYNPYQPINSYARGGQANGMNGNYSMGAGYVDGNSYLYREPMYPMRDYSRNGSKQEIVSELHEIMGETSDKKVKDAIQKVLQEINE